MPIKVIPFAKCLECKYLWVEKNMYSLSEKCPKCDSTKLDFMFAEEVHFD